MHRRALLLILALPAAGCASLGAPVPAPVTPARRTEPASLKARVRQEGWMARFWEELTPNQRNRVLARMRQQGGPTLARDDAAARWDAMGLPERDALLGGTGAVVVRQ